MYRRVVMPHSRLCTRIIVDYASSILLPLDPNKNHKSSGTCNRSVFVRKTLIVAPTIESKP